MRKPGLPLAFLLALAAPAAAKGPTPEVVRAAGVQFAREVAGVVAYVGEAETSLDIPMKRSRSRTRMWIANVDGRPTRARVLALVVDGKPAGEAERAKLEAQTNAAYARGERGFDAPYDPAHQAAYALTPTSCDGCAPGQTAWAFTSTARDERHGDGTFVLAPSGHVARVRYSPNVLPRGAGSAEVTLTRGPAPGLGWALQRVQARYAGGVGPLQGSFTLDQRVTGHRRFASVAAAMASAPK